MSSAQPRRELYVNSVATWLWGQGTLVASVVALPLLTRLLPKSEFGLWSQLLALSALGTLADFGMSSVFVRRITSEPESSPVGVLRAAGRFYATTGTILGLVLLLVCLVPGGLVAPFAGHTDSPGLGAVIVVVAIVVNLVVQPFTIRLGSRGRLDVENIFGAGPAVVGTLLTILAAYLFRSALGVAGAYAIVEVLFDVGLVVLVVRSPHFRFADRREHPVAPVRWLELFSESWRVLTINLTPQLMVFIDVAVVGRVVGPIAVALYSVAARSGYLVTRVFSPLTSSLFVSFCRTTASQRVTLESQAASLGWLVLSSGFAFGAILAASGAHVLTLIFGHGYGAAEGAICVLLAAATIRNMYMASVMRIQADGALGSIPKWFAAGVAVHVGLAIAFTLIWSTVGTAIAVLVSAVLFEAWPVARAAGRHPGKSRLSERISAKQLGVGLLGGVTVLALTWCRVHIGGWSIAVCIGLAVALTVASVGLLVGYLRSSRDVLI